MKCVQLVLSLKEWGPELEGPSTYPTYRDVNFQVTVLGNQIS